MLWIFDASCSDFQSASEFTGPWSAFILWKSSFGRQNHRISLEDFAKIHGSFADLSNFTTWKCRNEKWRFSRKCFCFFSGRRLAVCSTALSERCLLWGTHAIAIWCHNAAHFQIKISFCLAIRWHLATMWWWRHESGPGFADLVWSVQFHLVMQVHHRAGHSCVFKEQHSEVEFDSRYMQQGSKVHTACSIRKERVTWVKDMILECIARTDSEETLQLNFDPFDTDRRLTLSIMSQAQTQQLKIMTCSGRTQEYMHCKGPWFMKSNSFRCCS